MVGGGLLPTAYRSEAYCLLAPRAHPLLPLTLVLRRMLALAGFLVIVALALMLFYRVYIHHTRAEPYVDESPAIVRLDVKIARASS